MNRRELLRAMLAVGGIGATARSVTATPRKFGFLDVRGHRTHKELTGEDLHVFVDGKDMTLRCYEADDIAGYARVLCRDEQQHRELDALQPVHVRHVGGACFLELRGEVVIAPGPDLNSHA